MYLPVTLRNKLLRFLLNDQEKKLKKNARYCYEKRSAKLGQQPGISPPEIRAMLFVLPLGAVREARLSPAVRRPTPNSGGEATEASRKGSEVVAAEHVPEGPSRP